MEKNAFGLLHAKQISDEYYINIYLLITVFTYLLICSSIIKAQPSGGPYGPIQQIYEIPKTSGKIYYVSTEGNSNSPGDNLENPTSIESAIEKVRTNDVIIMRGGTYRTGNLIINQGITIQPYRDELPIFKGTLIAKDWNNLGNGLWTTSWKSLFPSKPADWWRRNREGKKTPLHRFNDDMVFVDGKFLQSAGWEGEVNEDSYYIDYETGTVYIGTDPTNRLVEITAFNIALLRTTGEIHGKISDKKGPTIKGITFTQYAYRAIEIEGIDPEGISSEANHGKEVIGTTLENCTITFCSRVAGYLRGDKMTIRNCLISDTSTEGIYILSSSDVLLEKNIFRRNNIERITGYYPAAVKIFNQCYRVTCNDNLVIEHPYSNGIWYDVGNVDGVFTNNWIEGVGNIRSDFNVNQPWPSDNGFFFEISKGAICTGNVFVNCDHGIWILNSSDVHVYNNTFINSTACIARNTRSAVGDHFGWHPATGPDVDERDGHIFKNNLLVGDEYFDRPLLYVWQPAVLCEKLTDPQLTELDYNTYVRTGSTLHEPLIIWSPAKNEKCQINLSSISELNSLHNKFEKNGNYFPNYMGPLFKSSELGNFQLLQQFPASDKATKIPPDIGKLINQTRQYIGAYPPVK